MQAEASPGQMHAKAIVFFMCRCHRCHHAVNWHEFLNRPSVSVNFNRTNQKQNQYAQTLTSGTILTAVLVQAVHETHKRMLNESR